MSAGEGVERGGRLLPMPNAMRARLGDPEPPQGRETPLWLRAERGEAISDELLPDHIKPIAKRLRRAVREPGEAGQVAALKAYVAGEAALKPAGKGAEAKAKAKDLGRWLPWLRNLYMAVTEREAVGYNRAGLEAAFERMNIRVRENVRTRQPEISLAGGAFESMRPRWPDGIAEEIAARFVFVGGIREARFAVARFQTAFNAVLDDHRVDPFREWIDSLPPWDGDNRLDTLLPDCFTVDTEADPDLVRHASRLLVLGPLTRTMRPGYKLDEMLILTGPQGIGKSTLCESILPPEIPDLFATGLQFQWDDKRLVEKIRGRAIVEIAELGGMTHADTERLKMFVTSTADTVRLAYDREVSRILRTCLFVGTTNNPEPLPNDPTGLRRWIVVGFPSQRSRTGSIRLYMGEWRAQLWAEALERYRAGERPELPAALAAVAAKDNFRRRAKDPYEDRISEMNSLRTAWPKSLTEIGDHLGIPVHDMRNAHRLGKSLRNSGFEKRKVRLGNRTMQKWFPPEIDPSDLL